MMTNREIEMYDYILECGIATADELNLARNLVDGTWEDVLNAVLSVRTGYSTLEQMLEDEEDEYYEPSDLEEGFDPYEGCYTFDC